MNQTARMESGRGLRTPGPLGESGTSMGLGQGP